MSRSYKKNMVLNYDKKDKARKRYLNKKARRADNIPNGGGYKKVEMDYEAVVRFNGDVNNWNEIKLYKNK